MSALELEKSLTERVKECTFSQSGLRQRLHILKKIPNSNELKDFHVILSYFNPLCGIFFLKKKNKQTMSRLYSINMSHFPVF